MVALIIIILLFLIILIALYKAIKNKNTGESKLSVFEHPSTFEKPDIEWVKPPLEKDEAKQKPVHIKTDKPEDMNTANSIKY